MQRALPSTPFSPLSPRAWSCCLIGSLLFLGVRPASAAQPSSRTPPYAHAERLREALEGRPEQQRTRLQYERVLDAYRAIYHGDPASPKADDSIAAVAELLAEEGRVFQDEKALHDSIGQYEFLRRQYPGSRYRFSALLTEGEIYQRDLEDPVRARTLYLQFLHEYPHHPLAEQARAELKELRRGEIAASRPAPSPKTGSARAVAPPASRFSSTAELRREPVRQPASTSRSAESPAASRGPAGLEERNIPPSGSQPANELSDELSSRASNESGSQARNPATNPPGSVAQSGSRPESSPVTKPEPRTEFQSAPAPLRQESRPAEARTESAAADKSAAEALLNAPPPPVRPDRLPLITGIRHWSTPVYTRVAIDLQQEVRYQAARVPDPDRIFFDLYGARLSPELVGRSVEVTDDGFLSRIRAAQFANNVTRIVLDVSSVSDYSAFFLPNPPRLIIDVHGHPGAHPPMRVAEKPSPPPASRTKAPEATRSASAPPAEIRPAPAQSESRAAAHTGVFPENHDSDSLAEVAALSHHANQVRATSQPTTAPVVASVAASAPPPAPAPRRDSRPAAPAETARERDDVPPAEAGAAGIASGPARHVPSSMMRALGLKINRIVIDAGHGGHDSGTLGPGGLEEKDVVLDVALRLGRLLRDRLGADVIYTRSDDTFIPLETRTAIANQAQADLFISVHANSSSDNSARGVEVYYLNFTTSADALEVAARENAVSDQSIHQLSDLVKKIALQDKINESREFASDVDQSLYSGLEAGNPGLRDRGVKKAPFVVLIGANMPSILAEISFLTNPDDARELRETRYRERIAESLYRGVSHYVASLNGVRLAQAGSHGPPSE